MRESVSILSDAHYLSFASILEVCTLLYYEMNFDANFDALLQTVLADVPNVYDDIPDLDLIDLIDDDINEFVCITEDDRLHVRNIEKEGIPQSTMRQQISHVKRFRAYLEEKSLTCDFEAIPNDLLNDYLCVFYGSLLKENGEFYRPKSLICIRAALHRHLNSADVNANVSFLYESAKDSGILVHFYNLILFLLPGQYNRR